MKKIINIYSNGLIIKLHNKRITISEYENTYCIEFVSFEKNRVGFCNADKRIVTPIRLSAESMNALVQGFQLLINKKEF